MSTSIAEKLPEYTRYTDPPPSYDTEKALTEFNALTPDQKKKFATGIAVAASSDEAKKGFEKASSAAAAAVQTIENLFITTAAKLTSIDGTADFSKELGAIQEVFRQVVKDSRELAVTISQYADSFDKIIVKFCADKKLTRERRIEKIEGFIAEADNFKKDAGTMDDRFTQLKDRFSKFVGSFSSWAKDKEAEDEKKIKDLLNEIKELSDKIDKISATIKYISASLAATLPVTGILAILFPPAAPIIMGIGAGLAGAQLGTLVGLVIAKNILLNDKRVKESQIKDLQDEVTKIKATRTQLETYGQVALDTFINNIAALQGTWTKVVSDATEIRKWLKGGEKDADLPEYMKASLDEAVRVYSTLAKYLKDYSDGVTQKE